MGENSEKLLGEVMTELPGSAPVFEMPGIVEVPGVVGRLLF